MENQVGSELLAVSSANRQLGSFRTVPRPINGLPGVIDILSLSKKILARRKCPASRTLIKSVDVFLDARERYA